MDGEWSQFKQVTELLLQMKRSGAATDKIHGIAEKGVLGLLAMRESHRQLCLQVEQLREETSVYRRDLDQSNLQLQNLLYEKQYYEKEIQACRSFTSAVADDQVNLMPEEEFYQQATSALKDGIEGDPHKLMLSRLAHELEERRLMSARLTSLEEEKARCLKGVESRKQVLSEVQNQLNALQAVAKPLQDTLAPAVPLPKLNHVAYLLPLPMYIIYSQLTAAQEALQLPVEVEVKGDLLAAQNFSREEAERKIPANGNSNGNSSARKHKGSEELPERDPCQVHPLTVEMALTSVSPKISVKFEFLTSLNLVAASCVNLDDDGVLSDMYPGDDGSLEGFEIVKQFESLGRPVSLRGAGRPYRWAQNLAGLDILPTLPEGILSSGDRQDSLQGLSVYRMEQRVPGFLTQLQRARQGLEALKEALALLSVLKFPPLKPPLAGVLQPAKATLSSWQETRSAFKLALPSPSLPALPPKLLQKDAEGDTHTAPQSIEVDMENEEGELEVEVVEEEDNPFLRLPGDVASPASIPPRHALRLFASQDRLAEPAPGSTPVPDPEPQVQPGASPPAPLPVGGRRRFLSVLRSGSLEVEVGVSVFAGYPLRPPLVRVVALREVSVSASRRARMEVLHLPNDAAWIEAQINVEALLRLPEGHEMQSLAWQLHHLRLAVSELSGQLAADSSSGDARERLQARCRLRGRDRHCSLVTAD